MCHRFATSFNSLLLLVVVVLIFLLLLILLIIILLLLSLLSMVCYLDATWERFYATWMPLGCCLGVLANVSGNSYFLTLFYWIYATWMLLGCYLGFLANVSGSSYSSYIWYSFCLQGKWRGPAEKRNYVWQYRILGVEVARIRCHCKFWLKRLKKCVKHSKV